MGRVDHAPVLIGAGSRAAAAAAVASCVALWHTGFHVTSGWRGISDPPDLLRVAAALVAGGVVAWLVRPLRALGPLVWLGVAAAPLVPAWTGRAPLLLAFQGRMLVVVAAAALGVALRRAFAGHEGRASTARSTNAGASDVVGTASSSGAASTALTPAPLPEGEGIALRASPLTPAPLRGNSDASAPTGPPGGAVPVPRPAREGMTVWLRGEVLFVCAVLFYVLLAARFPGPAGPQGDEPHYLAMTQSLMSDGDLDLTDEFAEREYAAFFAGTLQPHTSPASPPGRLYALHTPGLPALLLPAYAAFGLAGARLTMAACAALAALLVHRLVREVTGRGGLAVAVWAVVAFTPPLVFYALSIYPETPAALATAAFLVLARRDPSARAVAAAALAAAALPWLHPKFLPLGIVGLGLVLARRGSWRARAAALALFGVSCAALLAFFHAHYGRAALSAAYGPGFTSDVSLARAPWGLAGLVFDRQYGLLWSSPVWWLAAPGLFALFRARTGDALRAALLAGATALVGASFSMWWGGACPPARFLVPAVPAFALALAAALAARREASAALAAAGFAVVLIAADAPRALHNRGDGESALLRTLSPGLDLDTSLPSFVLEGGPAPFLALTAAAAAAGGWALGGKGLVLGAFGYAAAAAGVRDRPLVDPRLAPLQVLAVWDAGNLRGPAGPPLPSSLVLPLDLPGAPWALGPGDVRYSRRLDLPPGSYRVEVDGEALSSAPGTHTTRVDLTCGELLLATGHLRHGDRPLSLPLVLPAGARRLALTASGIQDRALVRAVRIVPEALVPRHRRAELRWPRSPQPDRYRVARDGALTTVLDRSRPESGGFRLEGEEGSFLVDAEADATVVVRVQRPSPAPADVLEWGGRRLALRGPADVVLELPAGAGVTLGDRMAVPVRLRSRGAWIAFSGKRVIPLPEGP